MKLIYTLLIATALCVSLAYSQGPVTNTTVSLKDLIDRRLDTVTTNNYISTNGVVTVYSSTIGSYKGAAVMCNMANRTLLFSIISTPSNALNFQIWNTNGMKIVTATTNNYTCIFVK